MTLPKEPFNNIAISLSGGGYRAASFHLGLLSYLSTVDWGGTSLLERVRILSTVSGGTFTGVKYAASKSIQATYQDLYKFMTETDLVEGCLNNITNDELWKANKKRSLINAVSAVYFEKFESGTFATLDNNPDFHLKEIIFNATEFKYGLPFRFQRTENSSPHAPYLGNKQVSFPLDALKEIRMADVISASSCFPLGFEPINFPEDFIYSGSTHLAALKQSITKDKWGNYCQFPIGLMDGGIVDNQGVDSVIWAEKRMAKYSPEIKHYASNDTKAIDLFIISDVSSPYMNGFVKTENSKKIIGNLSFGAFRWISVFFLILGIFLFIVPSLISNKPGIILSSAFATLFLIVFALLWILSKGFIGLAKCFGVPAFFVNKLKKFNNLKFNTYADLLSNRAKSAKAMISEVFMKQLRRFAFAKVYEDMEWKSRLITTAVYELTSSDVELRKNGKSSKKLNNAILNPSQSLKRIAEQAYSMGTTLWFSKEELQINNDYKHNMLDCLIACGQFTICFNLIDYIEKILWDADNENNIKENEVVKALHEKLMRDWAEFNINPFWMVDKWNNELLPH